MAYDARVANTLGIIGMVLLMTLGLVYPDVFVIGCLLLALGWVIGDVRAKRNQR